MAVAVQNLPQVHCEIVTDFAELESLASEWQRLWTSSHDAEVFQHFGWSRACWRAYESELSLLTPVVYRGAELIGILPLAVKEGTLQFLASPLSDYNDILCRDEDTVAVMNAAVQALLRLPAEWKTCVMENVPSHSRIMRYLSTQPLLKKNFRTAFRSPCPAAILTEDGTMATKLASKQSLRRHENHLKKRGRVTFTHLETREDVEQHLESMFEQHIARRAIAGGESHFLDPRVRKLFQELAHELDPRNTLRFAVLSLDDKPVAYHFGFQRGCKLVIYQLAFDVDHWKSSPGEVLFRNLLFYARDHKVTEFDFTRGGEIYKDRFANEVRANYSVYFNHDLGLSRRMHVLMKQANGAARRCMETLRKYPPAYRIARISALRCLGMWRACKQMKARETGGITAAAKRLLRTAIFDKSSTSTFVASPQELTKCAEAHSDAMSAAPVALSELAMTSANHAELKLPLPDIHERIAAGQRIYLIRRATEPAQIWATSVAKGSTDNQQTRTPDRLLCEQCWRNPRISIDGALEILLQALRDCGMEVIIFCRDSDLVTNQLRSTGFQLIRRTIHIRFLHWFRPVFETHTAS